MAATNKPAKAMPTPPPKSAAVATATGEVGGKPIPIPPAKPAKATVLPTPPQKPSSIAVAATPTGEPPVPPAKPLPPPKKKKDPNCKTLAKVSLDDDRVKAFVLTETMTGAELRAMIEAKITKEDPEKTDFSKFSLVAFESTSDNSWIRQTLVPPDSKPLDIMLKWPDGTCSATHKFLFKVLKTHPIKVCFEDTTFKTFLMNECSTVDEVKQKASNTWIKTGHTVTPDYQLYEHIDEGAGLWESPLKPEINAYEHVKPWPGQSGRDTHFFVFKSSAAPPPEEPPPPDVSCTTTSEEPGTSTVVAPRKVMGTGGLMQKALMEEALRKRAALASVESDANTKEKDSESTVTTPTPTNTVNPKPAPPPGARRVIVAPPASEANTTPSSQPRPPPSVRRPVSMSVLPVNGNEPDPSATRAPLVLPSQLLKASKQLNPVNANSTTPSSDSTKPAPPKPRSQTQSAHPQPQPPPQVQPSQPQDASTPTPVSRPKPPPPGGSSEGRVLPKAPPKPSELGTPIQAPSQATPIATTSPSGPPVSPPTSSPPPSSPPPPPPPPPPQPQPQPPPAVPQTPPPPQTPATQTLPPATSAPPLTIRLPQPSTAAPELVLCRVGFEDGSFKMFGMSGTSTVADLKQRIDEKLKETNGVHQPEMFCVMEHTEGSPDTDILTTTFLPAVLARWPDGKSSFTHYFAYVKRTTPIPIPPPATPPPTTPAQSGWVSGGTQFAFAKGTPQGGRKSCVLLRTASEQQL
ncbi:hypothetical protein Pelo_12440 [Pelomyxa schiedti]|nr:hypothetical protein Pelo_12440 [Pelomyxa schiedti]